MLKAWIKQSPSRKISTQSCLKFSNSLAAWICTATTRWITQIISLTNSGIRSFLNSTTLLRTGPADCVQLVNWHKVWPFVPWSAIIREFKRMNPNGHGCRRTQKAPWSIQGCKRQAISSNSNGKWNAESTTENIKGFSITLFYWESGQPDSWKIQAGIQLT